MGYWNTRGLRGSTLEEIINITNDAYKAKSLALIQKIPTPITPVQLDNKSRTITLAYFEQKSTVDYIGVVQGIPVCFDAKETSHKRLPLQNIHEHQIEFMSEFEKQGGIAFLLVSFSALNEHYYLPYCILAKFWEESQNGGRKSIPYDAFKECFKLVGKGMFLIHYLVGIQKHLEMKKE